MEPVRSGVGPHLEHPGGPGAAITGRRLIRQPVDRPARPQARSGEACGRAGPGDSACGDTLFHAGAAPASVAAKAAPAPAPARKAVARRAPARPAAIARREAPARKRVAAVRRPPRRLAAMPAQQQPQDPRLGGYRPSGYAQGYVPGYADEAMERLKAAEAAGYLVVRRRSVEFPDGRSLRTYRPLEDGGYD